MAAAAGMEAGVGEVATAPGWVAVATVVEVRAVG